MRLLEFYHNRIKDEKIDSSVKKEIKETIKSDALQIKNNLLFILEKYSDIVMVETYNIESEDQNNYAKSLSPEKKKSFRDEIYKSQNHSVDPHKNIGAQNNNENKGLESKSILRFSNDPEIINEKY